MEFKEYQPKEGWYKYQQLNPECLTPKELALGFAIICALVAMLGFVTALGL